MSLEYRFRISKEERDKHKNTLEFLLKIEIFSMRKR